MRRLKALSEVLENKASETSFAVLEDAKQSTNIIPIVGDLTVFMEVPEVVRQDLDVEVFDKITSTGLAIHRPTKFPVDFNNINIMGHP